LREFREATGQEFFGIIGMDCLQSMAFEIDPDRGRITFLRSESLPPPLLSRGIPIEGEVRKPIVKADLGGIGEVEFLIDSGFVGNARLVPEDIPRLNAVHRAKHLAKGLSEDIQSKFASDYTMVETLTIDGHCLERPILSQARQGDDRLLGLEVWSRFHATFDMPHRRLYLEKAKAFGEPWVYNQSGALMLRKNGETVVVGVDSTSPAGEIGIKAGDVILEIEGRPAGDFSPWEIERLFSPIGSSHRLKVRNKLGEFDAMLTIHEW
jgi:hypothetical protein